jgi:Zn-finger domain-containing protein
MGVTMISELTIKQKSEFKVICPHLRNRHTLTADEVFCIVNNTCHPETESDIKIRDIRIFLRDLRKRDMVTYGKTVRWIENGSYDYRVKMKKLMPNYDRYARFVRSVLSSTITTSLHTSSKVDIL